MCFFFLLFFFTLKWNICWAHDKSLTLELFFWGIWVLINSKVDAIGNRTAWFDRNFSIDFCVNDERLCELVDYAPTYSYVFRLNEIVYPIHWPWTIDHWPFTFINFNVHLNKMHFFFHSFSSIYRRWNEITVTIICKLCNACVGFTNGRLIFFFFFFCRMNAFCQYILSICRIW